jgi:hypothetical protein
MSWIVKQVRQHARCDIKRNIVAVVTELLVPAIVFIAFLL